LQRLPRKVVMASANAGKLREIERILGELKIAVVPQSDFGVDAVEETGSTFAENALIKARHAAQISGLAAIADDSGLAVEVLGGRPGVYSARYSGPNATDASNIDRLLSELEGVPDDQRAAAFHCVACFVSSADAEPVVAEGEWRGRILRERRGDGGFGYDPIFFDMELKRSSAEMSADEKNARSHRGNALRALARQLRELE